MKLRTIEISGFKSFADHTRIDFKDGITGIVGPNGSGKSNIIEAVRWVMGETSAKSLRGGKMPDVIFSGTEKRKPLARAAVTIIFDNSDHFLDSKYDEVMVTRRLFRNGDSQYEINKQECRLKDVLNLFIDTGLGRESFSIISQGRVEAIFNSKPEDRRAIIEEAAGVLEYKQDKKRAEKELEKTSGYLERVNDLTVELEKQVQPLEEQAAVAKDYLEQKHRFDILDQTKLVYTINHNSELQTNLARERQVQTKNVTELTTTMNQLASQRVNVKASLSTQNEQKDQLQKELVHLNRLEEQLKGEKDLQLERQKHVDQENNRLKTEKDQLVLQINEDSEKLVDLKKDANRIINLIDTKNAELKMLTENDREHQERLLKQQIERLRADYVDHLQELTSLKNQYNFNQQDQKRDEQQRQKVMLTIETLKKQILERQDSKDRLKKTLDEVESNVDHQQATVTKLTNKRDQLRLKYDEQRQQWLDGSNVAHRVESKLEALSNLKNEYTGFYQGVRAVLQQKENFDGIVGSVSEVMDVPEKYTLAIETALGNQVQNVVVDTDQTAKKLIQFLKKNRQGRVTFLPKNALRHRQLSTDIIKAVKDMPGFIGIAASLVQIHPENEVIGQYLLGTTLIVDTLENATNISKQIQRRSRIITLEGDVIGIGGTMTGGATRKNQHGVLQQDQEIKKLSSQLTKMKHQLADKEVEVQKILESGKKVQAELDQLLAQQQLKKQQQSELNNQITLEVDRIQELERRQKATQFELNQIDEDRENTGDLSPKITELQKMVEQIKRETEEKQTRLGQLTDNADERQNQIASLKVELAKLKEQSTQRYSLIEELELKIENYENQSEKYQKQIDDLNQTVVSSGELRQYDLEDVKKQLRVQNAALERIQTMIQESQVKQDQVTADYEITQQKLNQSKTQLKETEGTLALVQSKIEMAVDKLAEEYHQTIESVQSIIIANMKEEQLNRELKLLRLGLNELGTVNLGAIDEYERVSTRYNFLTEQRTDLMRSKEQLEQSIDEIDQEAGQRFKQTFDQVASEFAKVFVKMFGGGKAKLELTNPDDILTTGIEIKAQPPGKKLQRLSLLSGGEKSLTAITLLFAILQVKPVPFCILDEVEAAFDDANVDRFAKYLKTFRDTTQFIVITHRKGTMMESDVLYGVTMQESGVSKMVSVSMEEAEQRELV